MARRSGHVFMFAKALTQCGICSASRPSLDSLVIGEAQIAGQVKRAYETAHAAGTAGPVLHVLFQQAHAVAKRVRTQTGISRGHVSVSSVAVDYVRQVFDHFGDKTILVIGAGKDGGS